MIINQQSQYHWQLVLVTHQDTERVLQNGVLLIFLNKHFPNIAPTKWCHTDFDVLASKDIFGTCLMQQNDKLAAYLKQCCYDSMIGKSIHGWTNILDALAETSALSVYAYAKSISLSTQKRIFINAHMTTQRTQEFDNEVFIAKTKESVYKSIKT